MAARREQLRKTRIDTIETKRQDGRWFKTTAQQTHQGGMVIVREDITERRQMEQSLRDREALVRQVLEACPAFITMNRLKDGIIIYESPAALELLGYETAQIGQSLASRWVNKSDREAFVQRIRSTGAVDDFETRYRKANDEEFWCAISSRLIEYQGEEVLVNHLIDLTERRATEAELNRQREMLHQSEKLSALGELLASVAHELNNPLSVVTGQALRLQQITNDTDITERAAKISNAADRCARIVKTFLAIARQQPGESKTVDLNTIIEATVEVMAYMLRSSGIDVHLNLAKALPPVVGDADQLSQVVINLMLNAQQALEGVPEPRQLTLSSMMSSKQKTNHLAYHRQWPWHTQQIYAREFLSLFSQPRKLARAPASD